MKPGEKVVIVYDTRGIYPYREYPATVKKVTASGLLRIETDAREHGKPIYNELFYPMVGGMARGWNTLYWLLPRGEEPK